MRLRDLLLQLLLALVAGELLASLPLLIGRSRLAWLPDLLLLVLLLLVPRLADLWARRRRPD
jgi:hypothetical protein